MHHRQFSLLPRAIMFTCLTLAVAGCGDDGNQSGQQGASGQGSASQWRQTLEAAKEDMSETARTFTDTLANKFSTLEGDVDKLRERAEANSGQLGERWAQKKQVLDEKMQAMKREATELAEAAPEDWSEASSQAASAYEDVRAAYKDAVNYLDSQLGDS